MKESVRSAVVGVLLVCLLVSAASCTGSSSLQQQFIDGFMATHNSMAQAEKLQQEAANDAQGGLYQVAAAKMAQAKTHAEDALLDIPTVVSEMRQHNTGVSEGELVRLLVSRVTSFIDGAEHFLNSMRYAQQGSVRMQNDETGQANDSFHKSWQAWYDLYDMVQTDTNLSYLRDAMQWAE